MTDARTHRRKNALALLGIVLLGLSGSANAERIVTVTAGSTPLANTPVTAPLPEELADGARLIDVATGDSVVLQQDLMASKPAVTWIIDALPAGESKQYRLESGSWSASSADEGVRFEKTADGLDISIDGEYFTTYRTDAGPKPYCWPIIGPTGEPVTRSYPMKKGVPNEEDDHVHHRSFWFTHGKVGGEDFWSERTSSGKTVHREFLEMVDGPVFGQFTTKVDWINDSGEKVCEDIRRMRVYDVPKARLFDFEIAIEATEGDLLFGDDKEGTFGFRVAGTMKVDGKVPFLSKNGTIVNSEGNKDLLAWGKRAAWCDYHGPVAGKTVGIAIFDHPNNLRHPTYWHVRTYGLFCANPFGVSFFEKDDSKDGSHTVAEGEQLRQFYRVYIHEGDEKAAQVADRFADFAEPPTITVE